MLEKLINVFLHQDSQAEKSEKYCLTVFFHYWRQKIQPRVHVF